MLLSTSSKLFIPAFAVIQRKRVFRPLHSGVCVFIGGVGGPEVPKLRVLMDLYITGTYGYIFLGADTRRYQNLRSDPKNICQARHSKKMNATFRFVSSRISCHLSTIFSAKCVVHYRKGPFFSRSYS